MKFKLEINLDNDAMSRPSNIANALTTLADEMFHWTAGDPFSKIRMRKSTVINGSVRDDNGNTVGRWDITKPLLPIAVDLDMWKPGEDVDTDELVREELLQHRVAAGEFLSEVSLIAWEPGEDADTDALVEQELRDFRKRAADKS